jgi:hypothetical protein
LLRTALRQPLLHFVLLGALVFIVDAQLSRSSQQIEVTQAIRNEVAALLQQSLSRRATEEELQRGLEEWLDTEVLFREALSLGLEENDAVIRAHLARKLQLVVRERTVLDDPTQAELSQQLESNRQRYTAALSFDVTHVFLLTQPGATSGDKGDPARVDDALARLRAGADPKTAGDHFPRGPVFTRLTQPQLEQIVGAKLSSVLAPEQRGNWQAIAGTRGTHLLRLDALHDGSPNLEALRPTLTADVQEKQKQERLHEFTAQLRKRYEIERAAE